jgi:hypothetical protein
MRYLCVMLFLLTTATANADVSKLRAIFVDTPHKVVDTDTVIHKQSLILGVNYGSDAMFFGRTGPIKYPFVSSDAIYNTKNGIFVYGSALKVLGYGQLYDEIDLGGGYLYKYTKDFSGSISYTRFLFNSDAHVIKSSSSNDLNWMNAYDWGIMKSGVTFDYLFGKSHDYFITLNTSHHFESNFSIFDDKDYLTVTPGVSVILGTQNFVQRYSLDYDYRQQSNNIFDNGTNEQHMAALNGMFNVLNYSFKVPIAYNRPHYTIEFTYKYSIPVNVEGALMNTKESFYNLTFYYVFY